MSVTPSTKETSTISQKTAWLSVRMKNDEQHEQQQAEADIEEMPARQHDRLAGHAAVELQERDDRAREGDGADGDAERHLEQRAAMDRADGADAEGLRRIERARRHQHRREADQRVEGRDELRHGRHRHALGDHRADAAADGEARESPAPSRRSRSAGTRTGW